MHSKKNCLPIYSYINLHLFEFQLIKWANGFDELDCIYDVIICADCLFFDEGRPQLLECLKKALKPGGTAVIVAPSRGGTFEVSTIQKKKS